MSIRGEKVGGVVREVLSEAMRDIASEIKAGLLTVTSVRMSDDLKHARVYISAFGGKSTIYEILEHLNFKKGMLRSYVGKNMRIRYTPELHFFADDTLDEMQHIQDLFKKSSSSVSSSNNENT